MLSALLVFCLATCGVKLVLGCQLPTEWRPLSEGCRAELAEIIVYAKVLAIHEEPYASSLYNYLPYQYQGAENGLLYAAEIELLCDQAWGSMLEVPAGSRLNLTGLGYFACQSHTVMENYSYIFFLRMDENYNILPHGVNFQDAIFPDTLENRRMFSSLFQFSNCSHSNTLHSFNPDWESQEDSRLLCSSVQQVLFEEEERVRRLEERLVQMEKRNRQLKDRVRKLKRSLRKARKISRRAERERQQLQERLSATERRTGHHFNAISSSQNPPSRGYTYGL
ncbi:coiled-coil domain-containing protein 3a [Chanos chanos]|uniref:Coiled-coil domain-containing protein 3a n=1 Tax=Chanos chanos TaxID=29144 RepID=A0A6J2VTC0_CHACN|nr:coiled-coil domain-containing protein 3 [Chanos chanos]